MDSAVEDAFRWLAKRRVLTCDDFQIIFMSEEEAPSPTVMVVNNNLKIIGRATTRTFAEAFIDALKQARKKLV
jgi:UDP-N-acetyl-D-mannosaminuronate dehydrogenase